MKLRTSSIVAGIILGSVGIGVANAQDTVIHSKYSLSTASSANMERIVPKNGLNRSDMMFLAQIARVNMAEIEIGQLAQRQGGDWGKAFGKDMEREHTMALEELKTLAMNKGFGLPKDIDMASKKGYNMLSRLNGADFDRAYQQMMIGGHEKVLSMVRMEIRDGNDAGTRGYAVTMEPEVKTHLNLALKGGSMMGGG